MFKIRMSVHAKDRNGDGHNLQLFPTREQSGGFFLQAIPSGGFTALVGKDVGDKINIGDEFDFSMTPIPRKAVAAGVDATEAVLDERPRGRGGR